MKKIGGNVYASIEIKTTSKNKIGEDIVAFTEAYNLLGFLDLMGGESAYSTYNAKIQQSTHVFICDYQELNISESNSRVIINGKVYEITMIDNPMELNYHLEIFLKYIGE